MSDDSYIHGTAGEEQRRLAKLNKLTNPAFLDYLAPQDGQHVLDIGSGLGILAAEVARRIPRGRVVGVERSLQQLARAPRNTANLRFEQGDARQLPCAADMFDLVYCRYLLEHVSDPIGVLREARRVLKPGGRVCLQENDIAQVRHTPECPAFELVWRRFGELQSRLGGDAYIGRRLLPLLQSAGFSQIELSLQPEVHYFGSPHYEAWLENLIGNLRSGQEQLVAEGLAASADIEAAVAELQALLHRPDGSTTFYWDRATARK